MSKKKKINLDAEIEVGNTKVTVNKDEDSADVVVDTPNVDVEFHNTEEEKSFKLDTKHLDVTVVKEGEETKVTVESDKPVMKKIGIWAAHVMSKKLNKKK